VRNQVVGGRRVRLQCPSGDVECLAQVVGSSLSPAIRPQEIRNLLSMEAVCWHEREQLDEAGRLPQLPCAILDDSAPTETLKLPRRLTRTASDTLPRVLRGLCSPWAARRGRGIPHLDQSPEITSVSRMNESSTRVKGKNNPFAEKASPWGNAPDSQNCQTNLWDAQR
jgi:hypothetical protein